mmetsp:Transcript_46992/g.62206  ORF Transcript_46992/g.62206 Transcript_46992/m.62206 type:complete len:126 (+) Transcript_46992:721-1098(+)
MFGLHVPTLSPTLVQKQIDLYFDNTTTSTSTRFDNFESGVNDTPNSSGSSTNSNNSSSNNSNSSEIHSNGSDDSSSTTSETSADSTPSDECADIDYFPWPSCSSGAASLGALSAAMVALTALALA